MLKSFRFLRTASHLTLTPIARVPLTCLFYPAPRSEPICRWRSTGSMQDYSPHIELILGPMFSGKTSELIRRVRRFQHAQKKVCIVKYAHDLRYSEEAVASHDKQFMKAFLATSLAEVEERLALYKPDIVAIDEGQFFPDIVEWADKTANEGKVVIISALDGDFRRKPFGRILELVPLAERVDKLTAICIKCYGDAAFTERLVASTEIELIGAGESYRPVCRTCFGGGVAETVCPDASVGQGQAGAADGSSASTGQATPMKSAQRPAVEGDPLSVSPSCASSGGSPPSPTVA